MSILTRGVEERIEKAEIRIRNLELANEKLVQRISISEKQEQMNMGIVNDAINRLQASETSQGAAIDALTAAITTLTTDFDAAVADLKNAINSQPNVAPAITAAADALDAQTAKLTALSQAVANLDTSAKSADPGAGGGTTVNS